MPQRFKRITNLPYPRVYETKQHHPTQPTIDVPLLVYEFQKSILLIVQYKYLEN